MTTDARHADRWIRWEGFCNARDLGGLPTASGATTRYGRLIRSADTRLITAAGWEAARQAGVRTVIDLRNPAEVRPGVPPAGIETRMVPLDGVDDVDLWHRIRAEGLDGTPLYYRPFLDTRADRVAAVLTAIARAPEGGVIFHCAAGRDRTGLISLLLLSLAGATPEAIAADYALTLGQMTAVYDLLGFEQHEPSLYGRLKARGTTLTESITSLVQDLDVPAYLEAAGVPGADLDGLRRRLVP
ncbi:MAG: tyrosine-protein phosphatase [Streptosporangiales bacterium]|nr:tyrosine-protein phosphatase [Streptosporangiales bacterium]